MRLRLTGRPEASAIRAAVEEVLGRLGGATGFDLYSDHRGLTAPIDPGQLHAFLGHLDSAAHAVRGRRWAVVVGSAASFGMMRMLSVHAQRLPLEVAVFWEPAAAEAWLDGQGDPPPAGDGLGATAEG